MSQIIPFPLRRRSSISQAWKQEAVVDDGGWQVCPWNDSVTDYDKQHIDLFYRLMYDEYEGAIELEMSRDVFGINFRFQSQRARLIVRSHMHRARWLADNVFPLLGW